jgi:hypothetical protein
MKTKLTTLGTLLLPCLFAIGTHAAAFTTGNIVVTQVGDGVGGILTSATTNLSILEYLPTTANQASPVQTIAIPASGSSRLVLGGTASTEGLIARSTNGGIITFGGYDTNGGVASVSGLVGAAAPRVIGTIDFNGNYTRIAPGSAMSSSAAIRSAVSDGINYWVGGSSGGEWYSANGGTPVQISSTAPGNARVVRIYNGTLYVSSGSSPNYGINAFSGIPTSSTTSPVNIIPDGGTSSSPYDFAINPAGTVAYLADDRTFANGGGIQKYTFNGSTWSLSFAFGSANGLTAGCRGLAVDFSGAHPVIYATTADTATKLITITDNSAFGDTSDSADQVTVLATAGSNRAFRGVALAPSPVPVITSQPTDVNNALSGTTVNLSVVADGASTLVYHWYYPDLHHQLADGSSGYGGTISGSSTATLQLTSVATAQSGGYQVIITNASGSVTSRVAQVSIVSAPVPPTIDANISPIGSTNTVGDAVTFSVTAHGVPSVAYQWKFIPATNSLVTNILAGATSASLPLSNLATNQSGKYFVTITNASGYLTTNSAQATLLVNPPPVVSIATLRGMVDPNTFAPTNTTGLFTTTGIVTTWTNMTSGGCEFYIQDSSGGICIYWSGAAVSSLPPFGARVQVTGQLAAFHNLLEMEAFTSNPLESVSVLSLGNQPVVNPLPFDPNVAGSLAAMQQLEGNYFVASNVMLNLSTPNFVSGANDTITNNANHVKTFNNSAETFNFTNGAGQTFVLYVNAYTDIPNKAKYTGPVTIYGILGNFGNLFEFTPSRYADIISYSSQTNVVSNVVRPGDLLTNTYTENKLLTGETLTARLSIGDSEGGSVTLSPVTSGLPASASWSGVTGGQTGNAVFRFTPTAGDAGSNYVVNIGVSSTSGNTFTNSFTVYVPTADEQQIAISEFLANPTTNAAAPNFNPLQRSTDTVGVVTNDEYIEIANLSGTDMYLYGWGIYNGSGTKVEDFSLNAPTLASSNAVVVYGGDSGEAPNLPGMVYNENATSHALTLATSGGTIILRNQNGNIIDRVVYAAGDLSTNGSLTRFPNLNGAFVPQPWVSTNLTTAGLQYDGSLWNQPFKVPAGVPGGVGISVGNGQVFFNFTANTSQASTLWGASTVAGPYSVIFGRQFPTTSGAFTNPAPSAIQFYYISTQ